MSCHLDVSHPPSISEVPFLDKEHSAQNIALQMHSTDIVQRESLKDPSDPHSSCLDTVIGYVTLIPRIIWVVITEIFLGIVLGITSLFLAFKNRDPETPKQDKPAILLLHGLRHNQSGFEYGRRYLDKEEYGSVYSLSYANRFSNDPKDSIVDYAQKVKTKVEQIKRETGQKEIILIGHSMGGLVSTAFAEEVAADTDTIVRHVITLGTPWRGAPLADLSSYFMPQKVLKEMRQDSELLQRLRGKAEVSHQSDVRQYHTLRSTLDQLVPYQNATFREGHPKEYQFNAVGHMGLLTSPGVWKSVRGILDLAYQARTV